MNLKVPGAILPLGCAILSTRAKTVKRVGTTPLRRTRVKYRIGKSIFAVHLPLKLFRATVANADIGSFKSLHPFLKNVWNTNLNKIVWSKLHEI